MLERYEGGRSVHSVSGVYVIHQVRERKESGSNHLQSWICSIGRFGVDRRVL